MGMIERILGLVFGDGRNAIKETAEIFRLNAEAQAGRDAKIMGAALEQFGEEFFAPRRGLFDRVMDGLNRLPRPFLALGTIGLFISAMVEPVWFAERMQGIALVPEPLWWLFGAIISFYFGARHQYKGQEFQRGLTRTLARVPQVTRNISALRALNDGALVPRQASAARDAELTLESVEPQQNPALADWRAEAEAAGR